MASEPSVTEDDILFLRGLAIRLMDVPVIYGTDQGDTDNLNDLADRLEQENDLGT